MWNYVIYPNGSSKYVYAKTNQGCTYIDCYYDGSISSSNGTKVTNYDETVDHMNNPNKASVNSSIEIFKSYNNLFSIADLALWNDYMTVGETVCSDNVQLKILQSTIALPRQGENIL